MIYLVEDRKSRMAALGGVPSGVEMLDLTELNKDSIDDTISKIDNPDAILLHSSYTFPSDKSLTIKDVEDALKSIHPNVKIALYSGGLDNAIITTQFITVNSADMYDRLPVFINRYRKTGECKLEILAFGENYIVNHLKQFQISAGRLLMTSQDDNDWPKTLKKLAQRVEAQITLEELQSEKKRFKEWLQNALGKENLPSKDTILTQIQRLINQSQIS